MWPQLRQGLIRTIRLSAKLNLMKSAALPDLDYLEFRRRRGSRPKHVAQYARDVALFPKDFAITVRERTSPPRGGDGSNGYSAGRVTVTLRFLYVNWEPSLATPRST